MTDQDRARFAELRRLAEHQGIVLIPFSARRWLVVSINSGAGVYSAPTSAGRLKYITYHSGELCFGPAAFQECQRFIADRADAVPNELIK